MDGLREGEDKTAVEAADDGKTVKFAAEFAGASVNKDGVLRVRLAAPYSETGAVARLLVSWTKEAVVRMRAKGRMVEGKLVVDQLQFRGDGSSMVVLTADAAALPLDELTAMKQKVVRVRVQMP